MNSAVSVERRRCVSTALPSAATSNSRIIIIRATTVDDSVHPYLVRSNHLEDDPPVLSALDSLCDMDNAIDVGSGQTRSIWANNFDLSAAGKQESAQHNELTHRPNETKRSDR